MFNGGSSRIKFFKRLKIYKNSTGTVSFDPQTNTAYSYNWNFCGEVNGVVVFNDYRWSQTTACHQSAVRQTLDMLGIKYVVGDFGNSSISNLRGNSRTVITQLYKELFQLEMEIEASTRPDSHAQRRRLWSVKDLKKNIALVKSISKNKLTKKALNEIRNEVWETELNRISGLEADKAMQHQTMKRAELELKPIDFSNEMGVAQ